MGTNLAGLTTYLGAITKQPVYTQHAPNEQTTPYVTYMIRMEGACDVSKSPTAVTSAPEITVTRQLKRLHKTAAIGPRRYDKDMFKDPTQASKKYFAVNDYFSY